MLISVTSIATKGHTDAQDLSLHLCGFLGAQFLGCCQAYTDLSDMCFHPRPVNYMVLNCDPAINNVHAEL